MDQPDWPAVPPTGDMAGRVVLVTGASGGIGRQLATAYARARARVVLQYRSDEAGARETVARIARTGARAVDVAADLTSPEGAETAVEAAVAAFGRLDSVICNAGVQPMAPLSGMSFADWREVLAGNLDSTFLTMQAARNRMSAQGPGGTIVAIGSIVGRHPKRGHAHYAVSKAGVHMLVRSAAVEYADDGIRVNLVSPGLIHRDTIHEDWPEGVRTWEAENPVPRLGTGDDIAAACLFLTTASGEWITGQEIVVDGGASQRSTW
ncbi:SDR family NAD(P)-dependent oxidoreductase [Streptomyces sp. NPDC055078]